MAPPFNGVSVYLRKSATPTDNEECLHASTASCLVPRSGETVFVAFSATPKQEIPTASNIARQLTHCQYSSCTLFDSDCTTPYSSNKLSIEQSPMKLFSELSESVAEWR